MTTIAASDVDRATLWLGRCRADVACFNISNTGVITFKNAPDINAAQDADGNNVYDLIVSVTDGTVTDTQAVTVTVNDGNELPSGTNNNYLDHGGRDVHVQRSPISASATPTATRLPGSP